MSLLLSRLTSSTTKRDSCKNVMQQVFPDSQKNVNLSNLRLEYLLKQLIRFEHWLLKIQDYLNTIESFFISNAIYSIPYTSYVMKVLVTIDLQVNFKYLIHCLYAFKTTKKFLIIVRLSNSVIQYDLNLESTTSVPI